MISGKGAHVIGSDGREYLDWGMGLRSVILGHAHEPVLAAVREALRHGVNFTRPALIEQQLAERLVDLIPCAEMAKFGKNGSDAVTAAVRLARAYTGRQRILACADPFHASDDWWLSTQARHSGTVDQGTRLFTFNDYWAYSYESREIAAVVMEPMSFEWPRDGYLEMIREWCTRTGTVLIFDEIITGLRWNLRGAQYHFGVTPDLATFGKAIGNGLSISALVGKRAIMELAGTTVHALSSTFGGETHHIAAALSVLDEFENGGASEAVWSIGRALMKGIPQLVGAPCSPTLPFPTHEAKMRFDAEMVARGVLMPYIAPSAAHTLADVERTVEAAGEAMRAVEAGA